MKIKNKVARKFIEDSGAKFQSSTVSHIFYKKGHVVICIPIDEDLDETHLATIATEQLGIAWQPNNFNQPIIAKNNMTIKKLT